VDLAPCDTECPILEMCVSVSLGQESCINYSYISFIAWKELNNGRQQTVPEGGCCLPPS
jgi:hypothetical protein